MAELKDKGPPRRGEGAELLPRKEPARVATPHEMMRRLSEEFDRMADDLWGGAWPRWPGLLTRGRDRLRRELGFAETIWSPTVEAFEKEGRLVVRAELPGMKREDVHVEVTDDALTIKGERKSEVREEQPGHFYSERSYGRFLRTIPLPEGVEADKAKAEFADGVLEVVMPLPHPLEKRPREIEIKGHA